MDLTAFLVRLLIAIGVIWLTQVIEGELAIQEPARKVIFLIVLAIMVLFLIFGPVIGLPAIK